MAEVEQKMKQTSHKFTCCGVDLNQLLDTSFKQLTQLYSPWQQWSLKQGLQRKQHSLLKYLCKAKKEVPPLVKPEVGKMDLHDMIILPEMVGTMVGICKGKTFKFSITYKPVKQTCKMTEHSRFTPSVII
uniref:40S ribosomal protein S15 n=1 Tax=Sus scrofa TaxID=9823 RepID=A0A8D0YFM6_PIG